MSVEPENIPHLSNKQADGIDFLEVLNETAAALQRAAHSETAVYETFTKQILRLGLRGSLAFLDHTGVYLEVRVLAFPEHIMRVVRQVERILNITAIGYRYSIANQRIDQLVLQTGEPFFLEKNSQRILNALPSKISKPVVRMLLKVMADQSAIIAPILMDDNKGILFVNGDQLRPDDLPAVAALANHIAIALQNARLFQEMQDARASLQDLNASLLASRDTIHALIQQIPIGIQIFDMNGLCIDANEAHLEIFGLEDRQQIVRRYNIFNDPLAKKVGTYQAAMQVVQHGKVVRLGDITFDMVQADSRYASFPEPRTINVTISPIFDKRGRVAQIVGVNVDVTERKRVERALQASTARLARQTRMLDAILATTPDLFVVLDTDGRYLYASPSILQAFELTSAEIVGKRWEDIQGASPLTAQSRRDQQKALQTGQPVTGELEIETPAGAIMWEYTFTPWRDEVGDIIGLVGTVHDVTEQRKTMEAMHRVQKMESLGILAGGVAHDFNNLLVAMLGQTTLAQAKLPEDSAAQRHLAKATKAAEQAAHLTRQMLAYSGRGQFQIAPLNLNQLIQDNDHLLQAAVPKQVQFRLSLHPDLPPVLADQGQIQQVVMNLILNAAEALESQAGTITVITEPYTVTAQDEAFWELTHQPLEPGQYALLEVQDDGVGMDQETLNRIFDPFFTTKFTGRGLGLAAVLGIVRGHRGGLRVSSRPQHGAIFELLLPATAESASLAAPSAAALSDANAVPDGLILIIDDETAVRETVQDLLSAAGWQTMTAANGEEGIAAFRAHWAAIDLVLLDLSMPGMDGVETLAALRDIDPEVCVLLTSGYAESEIAHRFPDQERPLAFIQKPYQEQALKRIIVEHLQR